MYLLHVYRLTYLQYLIKAHAICLLYNTVNSSICIQGRPKSSITFSPHINQHHAMPCHKLPLTFAQRVTHDMNNFQTMQQLHITIATPTIRMPFTSFFTQSCLHNPESASLASGSG